MSTLLNALRSLPNSPHGGKPELAVLVWAASSGLPFPPREVTALIDDERLITLTVAHRMVHRLLNKIEEARPTAISTAVRTRLRFLRMNIEAHHGRQLKQASLISRYVETGPPPPIFVKGFSAYAHIGQRYALRPSGDLDVLAANPVKLTQYLQSQGMDGEILGSNHAIDYGHEYAHLADKTIEVQNFVPFQDFPEPVIGDDLDPAHHPDLWRQRYDNDFRVLQRITYDQLADGATIAKIGDTRDVYVPSAEMSALIICCHLVRKLQYHPPDMLLLSELADIRDLAELETFDKERFINLVEVCHAQHPARAAAYLLKAMFKESPLPVAPFLWERAPRSLAWVGGWSAYVDTPDLFIPYDLPQVVKSLGTNKIDSDGNVNLSRQIVQSQSEQQIKFALQVNWVLDAVEFRVHFANPAPSPLLYFVLVLLGQYSYSRQEEDNGDITIVVPLPRTTSQSLPTQLLSALVFVGLTGYEDAKYNRVEPIHVIPLAMRRPD